MQGYGGDSRKPDFLTSNAPNFGEQNIVSGGFEGSLQFVEDAKQTSRTFKKESGGRDRKKSPWVWFVPKGICLSAKGAGRISHGEVGPTFRNPTGN
jgi:hypothetical protein